MKRAQSGFVLVVAVMIISLMSILVTRLVMRVLVFERLNTVLLKREQAKMLAWSGVQCAIAQLLQEPPEQEKPSADPQTEKILFEIRKVMTVVNRWHPIAFSEEAGDGITGSCLIYIACEGGKLNPNALYDLTTDESTKNQALLLLNQKLMQHLAPWGRDIDLIKRVAALIKPIHKPLEDVTELLNDTQLKNLQGVLFLRPKESFALMDLCSVDRSGALLQLWALSRSVADLFKLVPVGTMSEEQWKLLAHALSKEPAGPAVWEKVLNVVYGPDHPPVPSELYPLFNQKFEADLFSVISYGTYNDVVVMLYALIQRQRVLHEGKKHDYFFVKKVYWI